MPSHFSPVRLFPTPWTVAHQAPLSMAFPRQEFWSELPFPSPGNLPGPGIKPMSPALAGRFFTTEAPGKPEYLYSGKNNLKDWLQSLANIMLDSSIPVTAHTQSVQSFCITWIHWCLLIAVSALLSHFNSLWLFMTPWTVAHQAPLSVGFSWKNTGVGCHFCTFSK